MNRLQGKTAIITGGATGIGEAISKKFAREGAKVLVFGMPQDPVDKVVEEIRQAGGTAVGISGDAANPSDAVQAVNRITQEWGKLDILINNAGIFPITAETQNYDIEAFDNMLYNNLRTVFMMTRMALPALQNSKGCIVNAGSEAGKVGIAQNAPYGGTKGFIHAFTKGLAVEQAAHGVRVNAVCPGAIDTAWTHKETGPMDKKMEDMIVKATPMGRRGTPEEMANVYLFLASDEASYVTGALFSADGGITVAKGNVGGQADKHFSEEPRDRLGLRHSMEGATELRWPSRTTAAY
jgi:NAD(P)-dependent dehydrogenase (short-subunit alcohol dehydrogenase family)